MNAEKGYYKLRPNSILSLCFLILLTTCLWPFWGFHLKQLLTARQVGAMDEGVLIDSVYQLVHNFSYSIEFHSKGQFFYYFHALIARFLGASKFHEVNYLLRCMNVIYFVLTAWFSFLFLQVLSDEENNQTRKKKWQTSKATLLSACTVFTLMIPLFAPWIIKPHVEMMQVCLLIAGAYFLCQKNWPPYLGCLFIGLAVHLKLTALLAVPLYLFLLPYKPEYKNQKISKAIILLPWFVLFSAFATKMFNPPYFNSHRITAQYIFLIAAPLASLCLYFIQKVLPGRWQKLLEVLCLILISYLTITTLLALANPYKHHAFGRPWSVSLFISSTEGIKRTFFERTIHRFQLIRSAWHLPLTVLVYLGVLISAIKGFGKGRLGQVLVSVLFLFLFHFALNKMTLRYLFPIAPIMLYFLFATKVPVILLLFNALFPFFTSPLLRFEPFGQEIALKETKWIKEWMHKEKIPMKQIVWHSKSNTVPAAYRKAFLIGEANPRYFYGQANFPRPSWQASEGAPHVLILNAYDRSLLCPKIKQCTLSEILPHSKWTKHGRFSTLTPTMIRSRTSIDLQLTFPLVASYNKNVFIYRRSSEY